MSLEELQKEMAAISTQLKAIEEGIAQEPTPETTEEPTAEKINLKQYFKKDEVVCIICNKGFKTLKKHLNQAHQLTDKEYKKQFNIPAKQILVAKSFSDQKKAFALENKLGDKMQAGRKASLAVKEVVPVAKARTPKTMKKAAVPAKVAKKK
jgi:predicted transcriptional regulator